MHQHIPCEPQYYNRDLEIFHNFKHLSHEIDNQITLTFIFHISICKNCKEKSIIFTKYSLLTTPCQQTVKIPLRVQNSQTRAFLLSIYLVSRHTYYLNSTLISKDDNNPLYTQNQVSSVNYTAFSTEGGWVTEYKWRMICSKLSPSAIYKAANLEYGNNQSTSLVIRCKNIF
jgi:hypothetical protein